MVELEREPTATAPVWSQFCTEESSSVFLGGTFPVFLFQFSIFCPQ